MKFVNLTGRSLTIFASPTDTTGRTFPSDGAAKWTGFAPPARQSLDGLPVQSQPSATGAVASDLSGLPAPEAGTVYIVAFPVEVAAVACGRTDCVRMGPGRFVEGTQTGAEGFASSLPSLSY